MLSWASGTQFCVLLCHQPDKWPYAGHTLFQALVPHPKKNGKAELESLRKVDLCNFGHPRQCKGNIPDKAKAKGPGVIWQPLVYRTF